MYCIHVSLYVHIYIYVNYFQFHDSIFFTGSLKNALSTVIDNLCNTLSSPSTVYRVKDTEVVFNSSSVVGLPEESVCSSLCDLTNSDLQEFVSGKQSKSHTQVGNSTTFYFR